jgi:hypothetical protein
MREGERGCVLSVAGARHACVASHVRHTAPFSWGSWIARGVHDQWSPLHAFAFRPARGLQCLTKRGLYLSNKVAPDPLDHPPTDPLRCQVYGCALCSCAVSAVALASLCRLPTYPKPWLLLAVDSGGLGVRWVASIGSSVWGYVFGAVAYMLAVLAV